MTVMKSSHSGHETHGFAIEKALAPPLSYLFDSVEDPDALRNRHGVRGSQGGPETIVAKKKVVAICWIQIFHDFFFESLTAPQNSHPPVHHAGETPVPLFPSRRPYTRQ